MSAAGLHLITPEYPPQAGGVSDYTRLVAEGLAAAGEEVHVWCPACEAGAAESCDGARVSASADGRVFVRRELGGFSRRDLARAGRLLDESPAPRRLLVQYVPHGYGRRSMNVGFCLWLWRRAALKGDRVELMVHEPCLAFGEGSWRQTGAAAVHRLMIAVLLRAARRVWFSIPAWEDYWRPYAFGPPPSFGWLPVPATVPVADDPSLTAEVRARLRVSEGGVIVGHLGTYAPPVRESLRRVLPALLSECAAASVLLLGRGGEGLRDELLSARPELEGRVHESGYLGARELSAHLSACDLLVQPFPDGVSTRRTSVMAALAHGRAVVTTRGRLTEELWGETGAVALGEDAAGLAREAARLLDAGPARARLGEAARALYRERFDLSHTLAALRREPPAGEAPKTGRVHAGEESR
ncbi:MAG TPA: glycosyltransferase family 4 protein [Pyrinomonadaceae bacterium]|nr:glycosyltransferase family 4 protein [Pyrinomonadaceae bacterium]